MKSPPTGRQTRRVTIDRIAREAGVSLTTVSRALNDRPDTRERILSIAQELGYTPSAIARSLATQRTHTVGLVVRTYLDMWAAQITLPIEDRAYAAGHDFSVSSHHADANWECSVLEACDSRHVGMDHLIGLGHRRVAYIRNPIDHNINLNRLAGYYCPPLTTARQSGYEPGQRAMNMLL